MRDTAAVFSPPASTYGFFDYICMNKLTREKDDSDDIYGYHHDYHRLSARFDSKRRMDRQEILRHRHPRARLEERRNDQHAPRAGPAGRPAGLRARFPERIRGRDDHRTDAVRRPDRTERPDKPQDRRRVRRRAGPYLPDFRRIPRRKGRRDARGRRDGHLSPRGAAVLRRVAGDADGLALRVAGLDGRRMLLPRLHPHIAQSQRIDGLRGVLVRDRHPADLHPPQEHRTAEGGNRVEDLHLEAAARETRRRGAEKERQRARSGITGSGLFDEIIRIKG